MHILYDIEAIVSVVERHRNSDEAALRSLRDGGTWNSPRSVGTELFREPRKDLVRLSYILSRHYLMRRNDFGKILSYG